jgi:hypothetical protein
MYSIQLSGHKRTKWLKWLFLISLMQLYLPLTWDLSRSKVHNLSWLAKRLRGWVRACNLSGNFCGQWDCTRSQKTEQEPYTQFKSPKMATWGILSNLKESHILWYKRLFFLQFTPSFNINSFLQTHLGVVGSHVSVFLVGSIYLCRVGGDCLVRTVSTAVLVLGHRNYVTSY